MLPFANLGGDDDQDYFADGVTEDIITDLSRFRELRVVARDSCFQHRTPGADLQQVGRALNADYVVTGSIRRRGSKLRLSAQLTQTESGNQVWAERFDRGAEDVFAMADELVRTIVATLVGRVRSTGSALARRKPPANLAAYECVLRGQAAQAQIGDTAQEAAARRFFEQALALDPDYPRAHAGLAVVLLCEWFRLADPAEALLEAALEHAETIGRDRSRGLRVPGVAGLGPAALQAVRSERAALPARHRAQSQQPGGTGGDGLGLQLPGAAGRRDPVVRAGAADRSLFRRELVLEPAGRGLFQCAAL